MFKKKYFVVWVLLALFVTGLYFIKFAQNYPRLITGNYPRDLFGVTYSKKFATEIGLDWRQAYLDILDELQVKQVRLPIYWDDIEKTEGQYDFSDYDYLLAEGARRKVKFVASIGWRLPRWPECHAPAWVDNSSNSPETQDQVLAMLTTTVKHFQANPEIVYWQVENEPLLNSFGECPNSDVNFLQREVDLVKSLDSRPVIVSGSGEMSSWVTEGKIGDIFASTLYRVVWNNFFGYFRYPFPTWYYNLKAKFAGIEPARRWIIELQAEPWSAHGSLRDISVAEANKSFSLEQFKANVQYAVDLNFSKNYLWGAEWWYLQKQKGNSEYWEFAKTLFP
jgi:hypothetical protein